jgi:hypothetical protein
MKGEDMAKTLDRLTVEEPKWWQKISQSEAEREEKTKKLTEELCSVIFANA